MNPDNEVKQGLIARQARIFAAGLLGVGTTGLTAYLVMRQPESQAQAKLIPVTESTPTVRTQTPLKVPELPFLVSSTQTKSTSSPDSEDPKVLAPNVTSVVSPKGLKNPFRPFRLDPKLNASGSSTSTSQFPVNSTPVTPIVPTKPIVISTPTVPKSNSPRVTITSTLPQVQPQQVPTRITVTPTTVTLPKVVTPKPKLQVPKSFIIAALPNQLRQMTLPVVPPVLRQTIAPQVMIPSDVELPVQIPDTLPEMGIKTVLPAVPAASENVATSDNLPVMNLGDKVTLDKVPTSTGPVLPLTNALEQLVRDRELTFSSVVLGPINTAVFRTKTGFAVVPLGQALPNSNAIVQSITVNQVVLQLGEDKIVLNLDRR